MLDTSRPPYVLIFVLKSDSLGPIFVSNSLAQKTIISVEGEALVESEVITEAVTVEETIVDGGAAARTFSYRLTFVKLNNLTIL